MTFYEVASTIHESLLLGIFVASPEDENGRPAGAGEAGGKRRLWAIEQAVGLGPRLDAAAQETLVKFLVFHAFYEVDPSAAAVAPTKGKTPTKGKKAGAAGSRMVEEVGVAALGLPLEGRGLRSSTFQLNLRRFDTELTACITQKVLTLS
jgi:hypothetical protein